MADYIAAINKRLDRAKRNFERFDAEHAEYMGRPSGPYRALAEPQSGSRGDFLVRAKIDAAPDWTLLVADIITDCRFALDFLAYQLAIRHTGQDPPPDPDAIEFPIFLDRAEFFERRKNGQPSHRSGLRKIRHIKPAAQQFIANVQPYKVSPTQPRDAGLWVLHELCNVYKHRLLMPALLVLWQLKLGIRLRAGKAGIADVVGFQLGGKELVDGTPLARFRLVDAEHGTIVEVQTEPNAQISFPPGSPVAGNLVHGILNGSVGTVDQIVSELARIGDLS